MATRSRKSSGSQGGPGASVLGQASLEIPNTALRPIFCLLIYSSKLRGKNLSLGFLERPHTLILKTLKREIP